MLPPRNCRKYYQERNDPGGDRYFEDGHSKIDDQIIN